MNIMGRTFSSSLVLNDMSWARSASAKLLIPAVDLLSNTEELYPKDMILAFDMKAGRRSFSQFTDPPAAVVVVHVLL